jgi:hypothetical protein
MRAMSMRLWVVPLLCLVAALVVALGTLAIDRASGYDLIASSVTGSPTAVQTLLSTIITAMVTLISVVLTVLTVAVQLAMGQFSPRIVAALLRDRANQFVFGLFEATCVYAIVALREVDDRTGQIPGLTVIIAYVLALTSLAVLVLFVNRAGERLRASGLIDLVGDELHAQIERRFASEGDAPTRAANVIPAVSPGVVTEIDRRALVELASRAGCVLELTVRMGDFVPGGAPLLHVSDGDAGRVADAVRHVRLEDERTHELDPAYGFRKLVDIAVRSASEDPSTTRRGDPSHPRLHASARAAPVPDRATCGCRRAAAADRTRARLGRLRPARVRGDTACGHELTPGHAPAARCPARPQDGGAARAPSGAGRAARASRRRRATHLRRRGRRSRGAGRRPAGARLTQRRKDARAGSTQTRASIMPHGSGRRFRGGPKASVCANSPAGR